jgi:hypothetical protein
MLTSACTGKAFRCCVNECKCKTMSVEKTMKMSVCCCLVCQSVLDLLVCMLAYNECVRNNVCKCGVNVA